MTYTFYVWDESELETDKIHVMITFTRKGDALKHAAIWLAENEPATRDDYVRIDTIWKDTTTKTMCKWRVVPQLYSGPFIREWELLEGNC